MENSAFQVLTKPSLWNNASKATVKEQVQQKEPAKLILTTSAGLGFEN